MASGPITSREIDGETVETVSDFMFWGSKITAGGECSHEIKRCLLLGRKVVTNLCSILKSRDITLPRVRLLATPRTAAYQAPLPMGFSRQEYWSGVPLPSPNSQYNWHILEVVHNGADTVIMAVVTWTLETSS